MVATLLKKILPAQVTGPLGQLRWNWQRGRGIRAFSQEGEDVLLNKIFKGKKDGFFVDVGANHPVQYSNTYMFYRRGWHGINIDPIPGIKQVFQKKRPRDLTLELAISEQKGVLPFYMFKNTVVNTIDKQQMEKNIARGEQLDRIIDIPIERLEDVFTRHLPKGQAIDFMNIDVEGAEEGVIKSNDWSRYRPKIVCMEVLSTDIADVPSHPAARLLGSFGYTFFAKGDITAFFRENSFTY